MAVEAHLLVERDQLGPALLAEVVLLEDAHGRVVGVIDLEDRLPAEQRRVWRSPRSSPSMIGEPLVGGDLGLRIGRVLEIGEREVGERRVVARRLQGALERLARERMLRAAPRARGDSARRLVGMAARSSRSPMTTSMAKRASGRLGVGALALERRQVRGRIVAAARDAIEPFARRRVAGRALRGIGVGARGGGRIARVLEQRGAEAQRDGHRFGRVPAASRRACSSDGSSAARRSAEARAAISTTAAP